MITIATQDKEALSKALGLDKMAANGYSKAEANSKFLSQSTGTGLTQGLTKAVADTLYAAKT